MELWISRFNVFSKFSPRTSKIEKLGNFFLTHNRGLPFRGSWANTQTSSTPDFASKREQKFRNFQTSLIFEFSEKKHVFSSNSRKKWNDNQWHGIWWYAGAPTNVYYSKIAIKNLSSKVFFSAPDLDFGIDNKNLTAAAYESSNAILKLACKNVEFYFQTAWLPAFITGSVWKCF